MAGDHKSLPHSKDNVRKHVYVCQKYPELRIVYKRKGEIETFGSGPTAITREVKTEKYLGFLKHSIGGIFETNDDDIAQYIEAMEYFSLGIIRKVPHAKATEMLMSAEPEDDKVVTGALGTSGGDRKKAPVAPLVEASAEPVAAAGPRKRSLLAD